MYSLKEIYHQAEQDEECGVLDSLDYDARICRAIKIVQCHETDEVVILNTTLGGGDKIKTQITENKSAKSIQMFKQRRLNILTNFSEVSKKLKILQDEQTKELL